MSQDFTGKVALVTGAAQGMGEGIARLFAEQGAAIVLTDVQADLGEAVAADLRSGGADARFFAHDVSREEDWERVVARCMEIHGKVDILVNNAGLIDFAPIDEMAIEKFDLMVRVNVRGPYLGCRLILPAMQAAGGGAIVNISSIAALIAPNIGSAAYSMTKGAVRAMTKGVAIDYVQHGIRVNALLPGSTDTPTTRPFLEDPAVRHMAIGRTPMGRAAQPAEIARAALFLASDDASFVTGSELVIDGGWTAC